MRLLERLSRLRRNRGYGVHSPLAFRLTWRILRPESHLAYYGYDVLESRAAELKSSKKDLDRAKMLLRATAEFKPQYVWVSHTLPELYREALRLAGGVIRIFDSNVYPREFERAQMLVVYRQKFPAATWRQMAVADKSIVAFDVTPGAIAKARSVLKSGIMLEGFDSFIMACRDGVAPQSYRVVI